MKIVKETYGDLFAPPLKTDLSASRSVYAPAFCGGASLWCGLAIMNAAGAGHHGRVANPDFLSVRYVAAGSEYISYDRHVFLAEAGDITVFRPFREYEFATGPGGACVKYNITIRGAALLSMLAATGLNDVFCFRAKDPSFYPDAYGKISSMLRENAADRSGNAAFCAGFLQAAGDAARPDAIPERLFEIMKYAESRVESHPTPESLARMAGLCKSSLNGLFRRFLGTSAGRFLSERKMEHAARLLTVDGLSVKETSDRLGFATQFSFSNEFVKHFGMRPSAFKKSNRLLP